MMEPLNGIDPWVIISGGVLILIAIAAFVVGGDK